VTLFSLSYKKLSHMRLQHLGNWGSEMRSCECFVSLIGFDSWYSIMKCYLAVERKTCLSGRNDKSVHIHPSLIFPKQPEVSFCVTDRGSWEAVTAHYLIAGKTVTTVQYYGKIPSSGITLHSKIKFVCGFFHPNSRNSWMKETQINSFLEKEITNPPTLIASWYLS
jgi:hypothetical protein